ncbi:ATP-binding protein [Cellulomonas sp. ATA003]|uniref:ATP-binding protein n=1 Tax=Cellulomonas sp. ATA003 TaxID=3073064 RepID=UPI002873C280|nr:ATP-binding protein [Cellulomonas sp. ATA003]WNB86665.1 ATP-binding protein [Cellulomonas sp. ATA003]
MELKLEAERFAARTGRRWVMDVVRRSGDLDRSAAELVELLAGELLANAVIHGPAAGRIVVTASREGAVVRVAVRDQSAALPRLTEASPTALGGRGVALVDALATRWGVDEHPGDGKTVWFALELA